MEILGWLFLVAVACYSTFYFISGSIVLMGFSGKSMGLLVNILGISVIIGFWYFVVTQAPFSISIN